MIGIRKKRNSILLVIRNMVLNEDVKNKMHKQNLRRGSAKKFETGKEL